MNEIKWRDLTDDEMRAVTGGTGGAAGNCAYPRPGGGQIQGMGSSGLEKCEYYELAGAFVSAGSNESCSNCKWRS